MNLEVHIINTGETITQKFDTLPKPDDNWAMFVNGELGNYKVLTVSGSYREGGATKPAIITVERII